MLQIEYKGKSRFFQNTSFDFNEISNDCSFTVIFSKNDENNLLMQWLEQNANSIVSRVPISRSEIEANVTINEHIFKNCTIRNIDIDEKNNYYSIKFFIFYTYFYITN